MCIVHYNICCWSSDCWKKEEGFNGVTKWLSKDNEIKKILGNSVIWVASKELRITGISAFRVEKNN